MSRLICSNTSAACNYLALHPLISIALRLSQTIASPPLAFRSIPFHFSPLHSISVRLLCARVCVCVQSLPPSPGGVGERARWHLLHADAVQRKSDHVLLNAIIPGACVEDADFSF